MGWDIAPAADIITQPFGCVIEPLEWPCPGCASRRFHAGIDLGALAGGRSIFRSPVVATRAGTVSAIGIQYLGDQAVAVKTDEGVTIEHGHLDQALVAVGQRVNPGDVLGLLGTKGESTAPHLHIEVRVDGPFQGVAGCPQNDPTRDPLPYLNKVQPMIAGLDSSDFRPSAQIALQARADGVRLWSGYLATKAKVGLGSPWDLASFENARLCGGTPLAFCSGWDDPGACRKLADAWNVRLCLDVEDGIRGDGPWVQPWLDASDVSKTGLYGNNWIFSGKRAAFYVVGGYPGADPHATWGYVARPNGPCGWQWQGSHQEYGGTCDRGWYDPWFLGEEADLTPEEHEWARSLNDGWRQTYNQTKETRDYVVNQLVPWLAQVQKDVTALKAGGAGLDVAAVVKGVVDALPHNANEQAIADLVVAKLGEHLSKPASP